MTFDELGRGELFAEAARLAAADSELDSYRRSIADGDVRAAHFVLFVGGRLGLGFLEDQLDNELGAIDDWLAVQFHQTRDRYWFTLCESREKALETMTRELERGRAQAIMDLRTGEWWDTETQIAVAAPISPWWVPVNK